MAAKFRGVSSWSEICGSREKAMYAYDEWNKYVKTVVPAGKLLVFDPKQGHGYKELATFLGVDGESKGGERTPSRARRFDYAVKHSTIPLPFPP